MIMVSIFHKKPDDKYDDFLQLMKILQYKYNNEINNIFQQNNIIIFILYNKYC